MLDLYASGIGWEAARDAIEVRYGHYSSVHTINNAAVVAAALLWGDGDYTRTVGLAVQGGWDTDCNGATAGSVFGAMWGTEALPDRWVDPLNDLIRSSIVGFDRSTLSDLAERTLRLAHSPRGSGCARRRDERSTLPWRRGTIASRVACTMTSILGSRS